MRPAPIAASWIGNVMIIYEILTMKLIKRGTVNVGNGGLFTNF